MLLKISDFIPNVPIDGSIKNIKYRIFLENISREDVDKLDIKLTSLNYTNGRIVSLDYNKNIDYDITMRVVFPGSRIVSTPLLGYKTGFHCVSPIEGKQGFISYMDIYNDTMLYDLSVKELLVGYLI